MSSSTRRTQRMMMMMVIMMMEGVIAVTLVGVGVLLLSTVVVANPNSKPYIPFRTDPYDQPQVKQPLVTNWAHNQPQSSLKPQLYDLDKATEDDRCPLQFSLGVSRRSHATAPGLGVQNVGATAAASSSTNPMSISQPPLIYPILPGQGPGRQILYASLYEHLDMLTPSKGQVKVMTGGDDGGNPTLSSRSRHSSSSFVSEGLVEHVEFPLLFESSAFLTSPVIADVNNDGILDAVLTDYHGGLYAIGLQVDRGGSSKRRYFHKAQVPRLYVRRQWMEGKVNETLGIDPHEDAKRREAEEEAARVAAAAAAANGTEAVPKDSTIRAHEDPPHDPYHSYFEYTYGASNDHEPILRGVTADVLGQDQDHAEGLEERRKRTVSYERPQATESPQVDEEDNMDDAHQHEEPLESAESKADPVESDHRRLQEVVEEIQEEGREYPDEGQDAGGEDAADEFDEEKMLGDDMMAWGGGDDILDVGYDPSTEAGLSGDTMTEDGEGEGNVGAADVVEPFDDAYRSYKGAHGGDDMYPRYDDYRRYDDYYGGRYNSAHEDYYDDKHYVRLPPHILCTPVMVEMPKLYSTNGETENLLFVAVSYYFDEDEYEGFFSYKRFANTDHGDETEVQRGMYLANSIMIYHFGDSPRWGRQEHLDLSGDHSAPVNTSLVGSIELREDNSKLGAFALSSPTVADIDGDGSMEVIMGTSMGFLYVFDARNIYDKEHFPMQFQFGIEHRVLVEDVQGDTNLEMFVADVGSNVVCIDHTGKKIWQRNLLQSIAKEDGSEVLGSSPLTLGDVNGDGVLDLVMLIKIRSPRQGIARFLFAINAATGVDLTPNFPINIWTKGASSNRQNAREDFVHEKLPPPLLVDMHGDQSHVSAYLKRNGTKWSKPMIKIGGETFAKAPHGGFFWGLHIVQPIESHLVIVEGGSGCTQNIEIGEEILSMVQADDVHGTNKLDLIISTVSGNVVTLESQAPFHPLNAWNNGELRSRTNGMAHGYSSSQGIFVHAVSRQFRDIFGVYVPVTFEIFDNRPNIRNEPDKRKYDVEIKEGTSNLVFRKTFHEPGVYTERLYIPRGPGYYILSVVMKTTHGLVYEDVFHLGYNVNYMDGFALLLWLPLTIATIGVFLMGTKKMHWNDEDYQGEGSNGRQGILGGPLPE